jgi:hypothetical protein
MTVKIIDFSERNKYITGTEMATVVKHFTDGIFYTYNDINLLHSIKKWSEEDVADYNFQTSLDNEMPFLRGKDWENKLSEILFDNYDKDSYNLIDFSSVGKSLANDDLRISATPDFLFVSKDEVNGKKKLLGLIETKAGSLVSRNKEEEDEKIVQYKYQVATQLLLLQDLYDISNCKITIFFKVDYDIFCKHSDGKYYQPFILPINKLVEIQPIIKESVAKYWEEHNNNEFKFISYEQLKSEQKKTKEESNQEQVNIVESLIDKQEEYNNLEEEIKTIKQQLFDRYNNEYDKVHADTIRGRANISIIQDTIKIMDSKNIQDEIAKNMKDIDKLIKSNEELIEIKKLVDSGMRQPTIKKVRAGYVKVVCK